MTPEEARALHDELAEESQKMLAESRANGVDGATYEEMRGRIMGRMAQEFDVREPQPILTGRRIMAGLVILAIVAWFVAGCAEMREIDQYQKEKAERQALAIQLQPKMSPEDQARFEQRRERELDRQAMREAAAMQALGMMNMGRGMFPAYTPPPRQRLYPPAPEPTVQLQQRQRLNCTTNYIGQQAMTHCD